jgi:hypothetical protein
VRHRELEVSIECIRPRFDKVAFGYGIHTHPAVGGALCVCDEQGICRALTGRDESHSRGGIAPCPSFLLRCRHEPGRCEDDFIWHILRFVAWFVACRRMQRRVVDRSSRGGTKV